MFEVKTYDHDGYNKVGGGPFTYWGDALEYATQIAAKGDNRYATEVTVFFNGFHLFTVGQNGAKLFMKYVEEQP